MAGGVCFPCARVHLCSILQRLTSKPAVKVAVSVICWAHQLAGLPLVAGYPFVCLGGLQQQLAGSAERAYHSINAGILLE